MSNYSIIVYHSGLKNIWNEFVANSQNATFLFHRDFLEYHQDRFEDFSLLVYSENQLLAILPANKSDDTIYSHQGLTYGGLFFIKKLNQNQVEGIFTSILEFLKTLSFQYVIIKLLPDFYHFESSKIMDCIQSFKNSSILKQNIVMAINYCQELKIHKTKIKRFNKLKTNGFLVKEGAAEFNVFWNTILVNRLAEKHNSKPVHSLSEIEYLHSKFEDKIIQFNMYRNEEILAGITIFKKGNIVKSQYGMASIEGEKLNALDMLFVFLIYKFKEEGMQYFSMGTVNNDSQLGYSKGMLTQKKELGCSTYIQNILKIEIND